MVDRKLIIDEWIEWGRPAVEMSSRKSAEKRRITELLTKVTSHDTIIVSELSRLGRSIREVLSIIEELIQQKQCQLILIKQSLEINPRNHRDMTSKILLTVFSMMAELERDFVSERTKEGLRARKEQGIVLGKPKGVVQASIYDSDHDKIKHLYQMGVPLNTIIGVHLKYGKYQSLKNYIEKRIPIA